MAKGTKGSGLNFTAKVDGTQARKELSELKKLLADLRIASPSASGKGSTIVPDARSINAAKLSQDALKKSLLEGQVAAQQLRNENLALARSFNEGKISAQQLAAAERQARVDRRALAEATRTARQAQQAASGSYDEANNRLKALGRSIKAAEGGFRSTNPAIKAQIAEYNTLNKSLKDFDALMGNHQRNVGNYKGALDGALGSLKSLITGYLSIQGAIALANQAFDVALKNDAIKTSLAFTLGSVEAADYKMKELKNTADRLGLAFTPLATTYASFAGAARAANFDLGQTNRIFNSVSGAAARFHLNSDQLAGSLLAIQQMISKGTVQSEELRGQLGERLPGAFSIAARAMGVSEKELGKLLQTGQVLASDLLPKLATELDKTFNLDASTTIDSLTASTNRLSTAWDNALKSDGAGKFFKQVVEGATNAVTAIDRLLGSRSFNELTARLFKFDASEFDKKNAISDNYGNSNAFLKKNNLNPTGASTKVVVSSLTSQPLEDLEKLRGGFLKATKEAEQAVNIYKKAIASGDLNDGGKIRVVEAEKNFKALQLNLAIVNDAYAKVSKSQKKVLGTPEVLDSELKTVTEINKRILQLKNDALANPGNKDADVKRITDLKIRLKELNGPIKEAADSALNARKTLQTRINELTKKGTDKQLDSDEQEVESVKDKYAKMLDAARKFNNDPENKKKGLRVDGSGLLKAQDRELTAVTDKQAAEKLKIELDAKKKLYDDYEAYKNNVGEESAKERYSKDLNNYATYLEALQAKRDQLLNQDQKSKGGSEADNAAVQQQLKLVDKEIAEEKIRVRGKFDDLLSRTLNYGQERNRIIELYTKDAADLNKAADQTEDAAKKKAYKEQAAQAIKNGEDELARIDDNHIQTLQAYKDLFDGILDLSKEEVKKRIDLIDKELEAEKAAGKISEEVYLKTKKQLKEVNSGLANQGSDNLQSFANNLSAIAGELTGVNEGLGGMIAGIGQAVGSIANIQKLGQALKDAKGTDKEPGAKGDLIAAGIGAAVNLIGMFTSAAKARKEAEEAYYASVLQFQNDYNLSLNEEIRLRTELNSNGFTKDYKGQIIDGTKALVDANEKYLKSIGELSKGQVKIGQRNKIDVGAILKGAGSGAALGTSILPGIGTAIGAVVGGLFGLFGGKKKKDVFGGLLTEYPELLGKAKDGTVEFKEELAKSLIANNLVDEKTKALLQNTIDLANARKAALEQINGVISELAGSLGDDLRNSLVQAFEDGSSAAKAFGDDVSKVIENIVSQFLFQEVFGKQFDDLKTRMQASFNIDGDQSFVDDIVDFYKTAGPSIDEFNKGLQAAKDAGKEAGLNVFDPSNSSAASKNIQGITSDQSNALEGILRGSYDQQKQAVVLLTTNNGYWGKMLDVSMGGIKHLEAINTNTANTVIKLDATITELQNGHLRTIATNTKGGSLRDGGFGI